MSLNFGLAFGTIGIFLVIAIVLYILSFVTILYAGFGSTSGRVAKFIMSGVKPVASPIFNAFQKAF